MSDLTPDHVAQVASRLYNESPGGHGPGLGQAPGAPVDPAADSIVREQVQAPSFPVPTDGIPVSSAPVWSGQIPTPLAEAAPPTGSASQRNRGALLTRFRRVPVESRKRTASARSFRTFVALISDPPRRLFPEKDAAHRLTRIEARHLGRLLGPATAITLRLCAMSVRVLLGRAALVRGPWTSRLSAKIFRF